MPMLFEGEADGKWRLEWMFSLDSVYYSQIPKENNV